jgi:hypothetical protein
LIDITYCNDQCPVGKEARDRALDTNNSVFDAAIDFNNFVEHCANTCPYQEAQKMN